MFENLPWYVYIMLAIMLISFLYRSFNKGKDLIEGPDFFDAKFRKGEHSSLTEQQLFSISLDAVITEWWKVNTDTLEFKKNKSFKYYLEGWGIDTKEGYWDLTNYFIADGRRWYFDFIYNMIQNAPEEKWDSLMIEKFGDNERAQRYFNQLKTGNALKLLKQKGFITFDSEIEKGGAAYDASILVGHARRAFTAGIITEQEAWKVIDQATEIAKNYFSSWEEFGKSHILGFTLDMRVKKNKAYTEEYYHIYKQVVENPNSPWHKIKW